ncbi:MAG: XdhC/CoxI family protein [Candidatus Neomarinimicrobiota bacterium]
MEKEFFRELNKIDFSESSALCTVVDFKGSVPRKDYPMMLVSGSGTSVGTIGGGTMEKETIEAALRVLKSGKTALETFDFTNSDLSQDGGLCGGIADILIEPLTPEILSFLKSLESIKPGKANQKILISFDYEDRNVSRFIITSEIQNNKFSPEVRKLLDSPKTRVLKTKKSLYLFLHIQIQPTLYIFGGGHVGKALADLAYFVGLEVKVWDDRPTFSSSSRFPHASKLISCSIARLRQTEKLTSNDYTLVATRGHHLDLEIMRWILDQSPGWIGLVSSRRKWKLLSEALAEDGYSPEILAKVKSPVGLDIHSQTVPEIAVSIIGQLIMVLNEK